MRRGPSAFAESNCAALLAAAPKVPITDDTRIVFLSDLHLGNGGPRDDFLPNKELLSAVLSRYYLPEGFGLVLNGDIEELQRHRLRAIRHRYSDLYAVFAKFGKTTSLYKIIGNHDEALRSAENGTAHGSPLEAVVFEYGGERIFAFHGHQATVFFEKFNWLSAFFLRYGANALRISNFPVAFESGKKFATENRVYGFSVKRKIVSIIGHTHRPLFESMSKLDTLKLRVEQLCRHYPSASPTARAAIRKAVDGFKEDIQRLTAKAGPEGVLDSLYSGELCVPCLFNSGCAIGKRGITAIEIEAGAIALVHWFDERRAGPIRRSEPEESRTVVSGETGEHESERLEDTPFFRKAIKREKLSYIFSRIGLLA